MKMMICFLLFCSCIGADGITKVWIDADTSAGVEYRDVDDAVALIQAFHSDEIEIVGISVVFGNTELEKAYPITKFMVEEFSGKQIGVYSGAASELDLGKETDASTALKEALQKEAISILALGPVTNIATVVKNNPELHKNIKEIIAVAGRRPGQRFQTGTENTKAHRDFNFERDPKAFEILVESAIPLVLAPFEISSQVWIQQADIDSLAQGNDACKWLAPHAKEWLKLWEIVFFVDGFNPFDTLAVAYLTSPQLMEYEELPVAIQVLADDVTEERMQGVTAENKPYLLVSNSFETKRTVRYCFSAKKTFKEDLINRLLDK